MIYEIDAEVIDPATDEYIKLYATVETVEELGTYYDNEGGQPPHFSYTYDVWLFTDIDSKPTARPIWLTNELISLAISNELSYHL